MFKFKMLIEEKRMTAITSLSHFLEENYYIAGMQPGDENASEYEDTLTKLNKVRAKNEITNLS